MHRLILRKSTRNAIDHNIVAWDVIAKIRLIKSNVIIVKLVLCGRSINMDEMYQLQNLYTKERIFVPGKREYIEQSFNPHNFSFYPCKIMASKNCYLIGNGRVTLRPQIQTNDEVKKGLWIFQSIDNISRNDNSSQERILITDICRGHNYPKQFTTYQIVSANDIYKPLQVED